MLESLRNFVGGWTAKILLILLVGSFALWGVTGSILDGGNSSSVAQVGETSVGVNEFVSSYNRNINAMQRQFGRRVTREEAQLVGLEQRTLANAIAYATLDEYAREQGLSLSDATLANMIGQNRAFQDSSGAFSRQRFQQAIYQAQLRESDFITLENRTAVRGQVLRSFATENILPDAFTNALGEFAQEERRFKYVTITPEVAGEPEKPDTAALQAFFDENKTRYRAPEFRQLAVLNLTPESLASKMTVTDEQVAADYEARKDTYGEPEKRRVQQIVFKSPESAEAAKTTLATGGVFEDVLKENNVSASAADLGLLARKDLPQQIQEVAFSSAINTPSAIIDGPFGPTIIRVTEIQQAKITPLADVEKDIRNELTLRAAADRIEGLREAIEDMRAGGAPLKEIAGQQDLDVQELASVDSAGRGPEGNPVDGAGELRSVLQQAFQTEIGEQASPLDVGTAGSVWYEVLKIDPARDRSFDEVKDRVAQDVLAERQAKVVADKAESMKARLEQGATMDALAAELNILAEETAYLKRQNPASTFPANAVEAGFSGDASTIAVVDAPANGSKILLTVADIKRSEAEKVTASKDQIALANQGAADDLLTQMIANLQNSYTVTQNPALINRALTQAR